ncbi:MAG: GH32 C-terminal domain-containing protein [Bacteroidaceae bacterium]|nr:GH32 C-terminal domain-containing protein [Bacteroidaceae bacterium]
MKTKSLLAALLAYPAFCMASIPPITHQACEQTIVRPASNDGRYLWLPIQENAPEGRVCVVIGNTEIMRQNVRMAREKVDYYLPLDMKPWLNEKGFNVVIQDVPEGCICFSKMDQNNDTDYKVIAEPFRPAYHHTPKLGWMNDPNGMFYKDGVWHLYYQYNPYGSMWGNMHWAHSTSTDLINWTAQPTALVPDTWGAMFSGSCIVDHNNTTGFGKDAVVAMYTAARPTPHGGDIQAQCLAYSTDGGITFTKYEGNPVLTAPIKDFRDPNMFWNDEINAWNLILACGQEMRIYSSPDMKTWKEESRFGEGLGGHGGVWECPDLMRVRVKNDRLKINEMKWVLICNINPGGINGGSATQYFIGDFDGHKFTVDDEARYTNGNSLWQDYGKDHYATVSFSNAPGGRQPMIAWMSNWEYANDVPTKQFRSANSIVRDPFLYEGADKKLYLGSAPAQEYDGKGLDKTVKIKGSCKVVLSNDEGEEYVITYDQKASTLTADRSKSGITGFSANFLKAGGENEAPVVAPVRNKLTSLRIFIDKSSVEVFGNNGEVCITNLVFPKSQFNNIKVEK